MKTIAFTGGAGMGKSAAAELLRVRGMPVVDTDDLARKVVEPGEPALGEIQKTFGNEIIGADRRLNRDKLAGIVFADAAARARLEAILHPRIAQLWRDQVQTWRKEDRPLGVVVVPLLFETGVEEEFDSVICVACSVETQQKRLLSRDWTTGEIARRNAAQLPVEQKIARSHYVVWNEGDLGLMTEQLSRIIPSR